MKYPKVIVIMPAYNAEKTLEKTICDIPFDIISEIIITDDSSTDSTYETAKNICSSHPALSLDKEVESKVLCTIIQHERNRGYGANQKTCYDTALSHGADIIIMIHSDYQYDPTVIPYIIDFIEKRNFDVILGSRIRSRKEALAGGMPYYKYFSNRALSSIENICTGRVLTDWHSGMRAYKREVLENTQYNTFSNDFIFDSQMLLTTIHNTYSIGELPIPIRYFSEASSINFRRSVRYGFLTLVELFKFAFRRK